MKIKIIIVTAILIINTIILCGCNQEISETQVDITKVELVNYKVEILKDLVGEDYRRISGFVRNNAGLKIKKIMVKVKFYDINNNSIKIKNSYIYDLANKDTKEFSTVAHPANDYYHKVDWNNIKFEIIVEET